MADYKHGPVGWTGLDSVKTEEAADSFRDEAARARKEVRNEAGEAKKWIRQDAKDAREFVDEQVEQVKEVASHVKKDYVDNRLDDTMSRAKVIKQDIKETAKRAENAVDERVDRFESGLETLTGQVDGLDRGADDERYEYTSGAIQDALTISEYERLMKIHSGATIDRIHEDSLATASDIYFKADGADEEC